MEDEINKILESITPTEYKSLKKIKEIREKQIDKIYSKFMHYEKNKENIIETKEKLQDFEYIDDINLLKKQDIISTLNTYNFIDLRSSSAGRIISIDYHEKGYITIMQRCYFKTFKNSTNIFKQISKENLVKLKLLEMIDE